MSARERWHGVIIQGGDTGRIEASTRFWPSVSGAGFAVLELTVMGIQTIVLPLLISPVGPPIVLALGGIFVWLMGRLLSPMLRGPDANAATNALSTVALLFWGAATALTLSLRLQSAAPVFSIPWQPFFATGADLLWVGNGWNWYVSCLILLLGGGGLLFSGFGGQRMGRVSDKGQQDTGLTLSLSLIAIASALFFTSSDNLLTLTLMWVVMDLFIIGRNAIVPTVHGPSPTRQFQGLSMVGALLLLIGLLPAGQSGPAETLAGGQLPQETVILMLLAGVIRAGVYPLHLWLLPHRGERLYMPDRLIDQMPPALCGLWLLGWSSGLAAEGLLAQPEVIALAILGLLGSAIATFTTTTRQEHTTFVLITSVGVAGLASILSEVRGPAAVLWPTTTFALGGGLWLIGERIWRTWHWQIPISAGVLALVGVPFTPGFLTQSAVAQLLMGGGCPDEATPCGTYVGEMWPFFVAYTFTQMIYVSSLLRIWETEPGGQSRAGRGTGHLDGGSPADLCRRASHSLNRSRRFPADDNRHYQSGRSDSTQRGGSAQCCCELAGLANPGWPAGAGDRSGSSSFADQREAECNRGGNRDDARSQGMVAACGAIYGIGLVFAHNEMGNEQRRPCLGCRP